jgi:hypothetical protein
MATDITLDDEGGSQVTIQAHGVKAIGSDFLLDDPDRRRPHSPTEPPQSSFRRALVHDQNDGLTLNFNGDYPGGITLVDVATVIPINTSTITPILVIKGGIQFEMETALQRTSVNLQEVIDGLRSELESLKARISTLEQKG